jgi:hypothetical protein
LLCGVSRLINTTIKEGKDEVSRLLQREREREREREDLMGYGVGFLLFHEDIIFFICLVVSLCFFIKICFLNFFI